jgi:hypothetical protein
MKGQDATTQANLSNIRLSMESYYSNNGSSYSKASDCNSGAFADPLVKPLITAMSVNNPICYAEGSTYAISVQLKEKKSACVDSTGSPVSTGVASYDGKTASCQKTTGVSNVDISTSNDAYTYTMPTGWVASPDTSKGLLALGNDTGDALSIFAIPLSANESGKSITDLATPEAMKAIVQKQYPDAVIKSSTVGTLGGKAAIITNFTVKPAQTGSKTLAMWQYNAISNRSIYNLLLISSSVDAQASARDFKVIVDSFKFK